MQRPQRRDVLARRLAAALALAALAVAPPRVARAQFVAPAAALPSQLTGAVPQQQPLVADPSAAFAGYADPTATAAVASGLPSAAAMPATAAAFPAAAAADPAAPAFPAATAAFPAAATAATPRAASTPGACFEQFQQCGGNVTNAQTPCAALPGRECTLTPWPATCCPAGAPCEGVGTDTCWSCGGAVAPFLADNRPGQQPAKCAERDSSGEFDYGCVVGASFLFYEAQRSGKLPKANRIPWRGDSGLRDRAPNGSPLVGGYFDAGDLNKFTFPLAFTISTLALGLVELPEAYDSAGQRAAALDALKWGADWLVAAHYEPGAMVAAAILPGNTIPEAHAYWGRPEDLPGPAQVLALSAKQPGADLLAASAAALAATSTAFQDVDPLYSEQLLNEARSLYGVAVDREGRHTVGLPQLRRYYESFTHLDDLALAAAWLGKRTGDRDAYSAAQRYLTRHAAEEAGGDARRFDWNNVGQAAGYLVAQDASRRGEREDGAGPDTEVRDRFTQPIREGMDKWLRGIDGITYSPDGIAHLDSWGNLRFVANQALMGLLHNRLYRGTGVKREKERATAYACFARKQLRLMLGGNPSSQSYVVGVGFGRTPCAPHHRGATCGPLNRRCDCTAFSSPGCNPVTVYGALVGGPTADGAFSDKRWDFQQSEVAIDYNAGFTGAAAALMEGQEAVTWRDCEKAGQADGRGEVPASLTGGGGVGRGAPSGAVASAVMAGVVALVLL
jgi:endoglucanase